MTGFVFLNKQQGVSSFFAAAGLRRLFGIKKVGHTGTLDPMATGVLTVAVGSSTRFIELIPDHDKSYKARFLLGKTTDTLDITGKILSEKEHNVTRDEVEKALDKFKGNISQVPPMYSAIKKDGVRLYELARQGVELELEPREVSIYALSLTAYQNENEYEIEVDCSKGTYIRSLIRDIGDELGCGAVMTCLERTKANGVKLEECLTLSQLQQLKDEGKLMSALHSADSLLPYKKIKVSEAQSLRFSNGGALDVQRIRGVRGSGLYCVYSFDDVFLGVGEIDKEMKELSVRKVCVL